MRWGCRCRHQCRMPRTPACRPESRPACNKRTDRPHGAAPSARRVSSGPSMCASRQRSPRSDKPANNSAAGTIRVRTDRAACRGPTSKSGLQRRRLQQVVTARMEPLNGNDTPYRVTALIRCFGTAWGRGKDPWQIPTGAPHQFCLPYPARQFERTTPPGSWRDEGERPACPPSWTMHLKRSSPR